MACNGYCSNISPLVPEEGFVCSDCGACFEHWSFALYDLVNHIVISSNDKAFFEYCPLCGKQVTIIF